MINFECYQCGNEISLDETHVEYESDVFCSTECLKEYLLDNAYYEEVVPYAEEDYVYDEADRRRDDAE